MMKTTTWITAPLWIICLFAAGCTKNGSPATVQSSSGCRTDHAITYLPGNYGDFQFHYNASGNVTSIVKHPIAGSTFSNDSLAVYYNGTTRYRDGHVLVLAYDANIYEHLPSRADYSIDSLHNYYTYLFTYDVKNRLIKVRVTTNAGNGYAFDVNISYNDKDNVIGLDYEAVTGAIGSTLIPVSGNDDKPTPFAGVKNYAFLMEASWSNNDPEPIITALSKNNPLGFTDGNEVRTMTYTYDALGNPIARNNTNVVYGNTSSFNEAFSFQCK